MVASPLALMTPETRTGRVPGPLTPGDSNSPARLLTGRVVLGDSRGSTAIDVERIRVGRRGLVFPFPWALEAGRHAWVEIVLPSGKRIRPLVTVLQTTEAGISARFVHLFPEHRRALDAMLASPSGY